MTRSAFDSLEFITYGEGGKEVFFIYTGEPVKVKYVLTLTRKEFWNRYYADSYREMERIKNKLCIK